MKSERTKKVAESLRREISQIVQFELSHPDIMGVAVTGVKMTADLKLARIYFALPGMEAQKDQVEQALRHSAAYVRRLLAQRLSMKHTPELEFFYDETLEIETKLEELFNDSPELPDK